jgi:hypothetical protein
MNASILLAAPNGSQPTYEQLERFEAATKAVATIASEIEKYVREGAGETGSHPNHGKVLASTSGSFVLGDKPVEVDLDLGEAEPFSPTEKPGSL